ncbi:hypothetical protein T440DRAFT_489340 [Plenodomus tracheiphilus IPT5]|uniref:Uncharacterized protein n=1 Tax=Plenodomus tracheiphilus IPT5 TaxID=1408161 RepID=A0A6A7B630_9PLEO|nr:hypothetical protein T440DRAFT_489340 [Plenodomus tracheiphilus IPT5]
MYIFYSVGLGIDGGNEGSDNIWLDAQSLFDISAKVQDARYDASYDLIQYSDKGPWSIRFTAWYLPALLHRNKGEDTERAERAIRNILASQMTSDYGAPWYGTFKLSPDQPDSTYKEGSLFPAKIYTTYDPNWREFIGSQLIQVLVEFPSLISPALTTAIEDALEIAAVGAMRRNGTFPLDDNLTIGYSNPAMMRALLCGWIGERRNNATFTDFANSQGTQILQLFQKNGANTLSEYNAPTYYGIDTWALGAQIKYGPKNCSMTAAAKIILPALWKDMAEHWNGYLGNMVGPYDRAYTRDITQHSAVLSLFLWGLFGREKTPQPLPMESDLLFDVAQGAAIALIIADVESYIPESAKSAMTSPFTSPPRMLTRTVYDELEKNKRKQRRSICPSYRPLGRRSNHKPYPLNTFFSLYPSTSSIHAIASANKLAISYPNRTQVGSDIFTFALSNVPPSWTLGTDRKVTGLEGLPCLDIEVKAEGLVKMNVTYGAALRNHLFYNVSYVVPGGFEGVPEVVLGFKYTC